MKHRNTKTKKNNSKKNNSSNKKKIHRTIKNKKNFFGGDIKQTLMFQYIKSIGFEIETTDLIKFTIEQNEQREILVNSALTNIDLEYGYIDENEYTYIINQPNSIQFKITNDSAEDSEFNEEIEELTSSHKLDDEECQTTVFKLNIPENKYLKQTYYDIMIREPDNDLHNCGSFTDVEWIITYYKPEISKNIVLNKFFTSMNLLKNHLNDLKTINNSKFLYLNSQNQYVEFQNAKINQSYVLPNTSLVYFNNSSYDVNNYNINTDLKFVVQMTFSCEISYVFRLMKQFLSIEYSPKDVEIVNKYLKNMSDNQNIQSINNLLQQITKNENFDLYSINSSLDIVKKLFNIYNSTENNVYTIPEDNSDVKMYFFLIIYKLYIYLNSYLENIELKEGTMLKKNLSFAVRHSNYFLYLEIKKKLRQIFSSKFQGKHEKEIDDKVIQIINDIIKNIDYNKVLSNIIYNFKFVRNKKRELYQLIKENPQVKKEYFGDPLYSISSYFSHFEQRNAPVNPYEEAGPSGDDEEDALEHRDWLVLHNIDEKSTKFDLSNDIIIIEFRDFPNYCYLNLFLTSNDQIRNEILQNNIGTLNMKIIDDYVKFSQNYTV